MIKSVFLLLFFILDFCSLVIFESMFKFHVIWIREEESSIKGSWIFRSLKKFQMVLFIEVEFELKRCWCCSLTWKEPTLWNWGDLVKIWSGVLFLCYSRSWCSSKLEDGGDIFIFVLKLWHKTIGICFGIERSLCLNFCENQSQIEELWIFEVHQCSWHSSWVLEEEEEEEEPRK